MVGNRAQRRAAKSVSKKKLPNGENKKTNGAPDDYAVGAEVSVEEGDIDTLTTAEERVTSFHTQLGILADEYETKKFGLLKQLVEARNEYHTVVLTIGRKQKINLGPGSDEDWRFMPDKKIYQRVA